MTKKIKRTAIAGSIAVAFGAIAMFALLGAKGFLELQISDARYALYGTADRKEMEKFIESEQARVLPEHDKDRLAARNRRVFLAAKGCSSLNDAARVQLQQIHAISELIR